MQRDCDIIDCGLQRLELVLPDGSPVQVVRRDRVCELFPTVTVVRRGIDGDGKTDTVTTDGCATCIKGVAGLLSQTAFRCCGC